jgi:hypothetical protein
MAEKPRIQSVEQKDNILVITFADGKSAIYTAEFLHSVLHQTIQVLDPRLDKE